MQCAGIRLRYVNAKGNKNSRMFIPPADSFDPEVAKVMAEVWVKPQIKIGTVVEESIKLEPCSGNIEMEINQEWGYYDDVDLEISYKCNACKQGYSPPNDSEGEPFLPTEMDHLVSLVNAILSVVDSSENFIRHVP